MNVYRRGTVQRNPVFDEAAWAHGIKRGDLIEFHGYAGMGRGGPEYKVTRGRVHLVGPMGPVVTTRRGVMPTVVTEETFIRKIGKGPRTMREPKLRQQDVKLAESVRSIREREGRGFRRNPALAGIVSNPVTHRTALRYAEKLAEHERAGIAEEAGSRVTPRTNPAPIEIGRVIEVRYKHAEDGKYYRHAFDKKPALLMLSDGSLAIWHPSLPLWKDFG